MSASGASVAGTQANASQLSEADIKIMGEIAQSNLAEIQSSELALKRSQNSGVREFAQRMIDEHSRLQSQLVELARAKDVQLPDQPAAEQRKLAQRLASLEGERFDDSYQREVGEQAHERTRTMLKRAQEQAQDPQLRAMVAQAMPVINEHMNHAKSMLKEGRVTGSSGGADKGEATGSGGTGGAVGDTSSPGTSGASSPTGESGASMSTQSSGGAVTSGGPDKVGSGAESVSGTDGKSNSFGPGRDQ